MAKKILRIDALKDKVAGEMEIAGVMHNVLQPTLKVQHVMIALENAADPEDLGNLQGAVRSVVPTLTDEQIGGLNTDQALSILHLAAGNIDAVEKAFPNAVSPETATTSPG